MRLSPWACTAPGAFNHDGLCTQPRLGCSQEQEPCWQLPQLFVHVCRHYFTSHPKLNAYAVVPVGPDAWWAQPHNRAEQHPV